MIDSCKKSFDALEDRVKQLENVVSAMSEKLNEIIDHINEIEEEEEND